MKYSGLAFTAAVLGLSACATTRQSGGLPDRISYETGPCFGACPVYAVTVNADGTGQFEGKRFTAVSGLRSFRVTPDQYRAFADRLAPLRPKSGSVRYSGAPLCRAMATDLPSVDVKWRVRSGGGQELYFNYGCDIEARRAIADRLGSAPDLLPIESFIGAQP
jgi:hypothetical protein